MTGRRTLEQLRLEPQGAVPVRAAPATLAAPGTRDAADVPAAQVPPDPAETASTTPRAAPPGWHVPAVLEPVVREQLAALAQGSASVPIMPWPGQQALLTVHEEPQPDARPREGADAEPAGGRLGLKLTLPQLGTVTFLVAAQGERIRVDARVAQPGSRDTFQARAAELHDALAARALSLDALKVEAGDA